jgi:hypothetical protein
MWLLLIHDSDTDININWEGPRCQHRNQLNANGGRYELIQFGIQYHGAITAIPTAGYNHCYNRGV